MKNNLLTVDERKTIINVIRQHFIRNGFSPNPSAPSTLICRKCGMEVVVSFLHDHGARLSDSIHVNSVVVGTYVGYDYAIPVIGVREILDKPETGIHVYGSAMWGLLKAWIAMLHKSWLGEYEGIVGD